MSTRTHLLEVSEQQMSFIKRALGLLIEEVPADSMPVEHEEIDLFIRCIDATVATPDDQYKRDMVNGFTI